MPLALLAITYFSDAYQDARSRELAEDLIKQAESASSWGQAQALLSRANGLSSGPRNMLGSKPTGPVGGLLKLAVGDIAGAEQRLVLVERPWVLLTIRPSVN